MKKLNKKVNINAFIVRTIISMVFYIGYIVLIILPPSVYEDPIIKTILLVLGGIIVFLLLIFNFVLPFFIYRVYGYELKDEELLVRKGVLFRKTTYIPIKRIQHIQKTVGPIQILLKLASIQIFTAGSADYIMGLDDHTTDELIDEINNKLNKFLKEEEKDE